MSLFHHVPYAHRSLFPKYYRDTVYMKMIAVRRENRLKELLQDLRSAPKSVEEHLAYHRSAQKMVLEYIAHAVLLRCC